MALTKEQFLNLMDRASPEQKLELLKFFDLTAHHAAACLPETPERKAALAKLDAILQEALKDPAIHKTARSFGMAIDDEGETFKIH
ncbi:MAG TPA: hypothetical protein VH157_07070 [Bryobacteraceae bacterium]|jgi:hypothetical protein|nr:hypothetical protein [Bryobacteraceae bacterium]